MSKKETGIITIPVAPGELIDKLTILDIKLAEIKDEKKLKNIRFEYDLLTKVLHENIESSKELDDLREQLRVVNKSIWDSEDDLRVCWDANNFGEEYVRLTTNSHKENDNRSRLKREINELLGSKIIEEKSHQTYGE